MFYNNGNHQLIQREQNYLLDRKLVTIHSYDRDVCKWPNSNHFEINLPETMKNVQSMRLVEICLPVNYYNFSNNNQNTKFRLVDPSGTYNIQIQDGFYTPSELSIELENDIINATGDPSYNVYYDSVGQKMYFGRADGSFNLNFGDKLEYDLSCNFDNVFDRYTQWGLPAFLGYDKKTYESRPGPKGFNYLDPSGSLVDASGYYVEPPHSTICIFGENTVYMEVEKYNSIDELDPFPDPSCNKGTQYCCSSQKLNKHFPKNIKVNYNGKVDAAFAKIPVTCIPHAQQFDSRNAFIQGLSHYEPPIERIEKLKFKFRTHDGRLVDFKCIPLNFTIEFNCLKDEIAKQYTIRVPPLYNL
jgi:hypothetical protein